MDKLNKIDAEISDYIFFKKYIYSEDYLLQKSNYKCRQIITCTRFRVSGQSLETEGY